MQKDLEKLYTWEIENNMKFNGQKIQVMKYGRNQDIKANTLYFTPDMDQIIEQFSSLRDLEVILNDEGTCSDQIEHVCKKVRQIIGWILRTFTSRRNDFMKEVFNSLVQPHIDYCSQLWLPNKIGEMESIEKLLKDFTNRIPWLKEETYWSKLRILKMISEERRLEIYCIIYTWKVLEGLVPNCGIEEVPKTGQEEGPDRQGRRCKVPPNHL